MSRALGKFRLLSTSDLHGNLQAVKAAMGDCNLPDEMKDFMEGLLDHLLTVTQSCFDGVDEMVAEIESLPQSTQGKKALKRDVADLLFVSPAIREKIKDRVSKATVTKAPETEIKKTKKSITISGRPFEFPDGMAPEDVA